MRLFISTGSPFVRKCRIVIREKGLLASVEEVALDFPYKASDYLAVNPLGQVPALVLDDGNVLTDSPLIESWLDAHSPGPRLLAPEGAAHWAARRLETLGDAIMEMAVKITMESRRSEGEKSPEWLGHWRRSMDMAMDAANIAAPQDDRLDVGVISLAVAATYVDFRRPEVAWREGRPWLAALRDRLEQRQSFKDTYPS